jgi:uncharacterized protein YijF (DUF1287 family)
LACVISALPIKVKKESIFTRVASKKPLEAKDVARGDIFFMVCAAILTYGYVVLKNIIKSKQQQMMSNVKETIQEDNVLIKHS